MPLNHTCRLPKVCVLASILLFVAVMAFVFARTAQLLSGAIPIPYTGHQGYWNLPAVECDSCDGTGLMEGWNRRYGYPCPKCHGNAIVVERKAA